MRDEPLVKAGARATIEEVGATLAGPVADREMKAATRAMWALGNYHAFAKELVWALGAELVEACRITAGQRVLDVAAGSGNTAIRAAEAGAAVVASDLKPENFDAGRGEARARGVELRGSPVRSSACSDGTPRRLRRGPCHPCCGAARRTCASCSAIGSGRWS